MWLLLGENVAYVERIGRRLSLGAEVACASSVRSRMGCALRYEMVGSAMWRPDHSRGLSDGFLPRIDLGSQIDDSLLVRQQLMGRGGVKTLSEWVDYIGGDAAHRFEDG